MAFLLDDGNLLFSSALALMLLIAVTEGSLTLLGFGLSSLLDSLLPDSNFDLDLEIMEGEAPTGLSRLLGWLHIGKIPALVLLLLLLTSFSISGLVLQSFMQALFGFTLPNWLAWLPALLLALPQVRWFGQVLGRFALKDETEAVNIQTLLGKLGTITVGTASLGAPAQARVTDQFGTTHYVMVEPDDGNVFNQGEQVLLLTQQGSLFRVIKPTNQHLL